MVPGSDLDKLRLKRQLLRICLMGDQWHFSAFSYNRNRKGLFMFVSVLQAGFQVAQPDLELYPAATTS